MSRKTKEAVQGIIYILPSFVLILIFLYHSDFHVRPISASQSTTL